MDEQRREFRRMWQLLKTGDTAALEQESQRQTGFPDGVDGFAGRRWIINAIDSGSLPSVDWMLGKGVDLAFRDEEGITPLHSALWLDGNIRLDMLRRLLEAGAPVNLKGVHDWTPAHLAAACDDVEALKLLVRYGADLSIRTDVDNYATPLEEVRSLGGRAKALAYLERIADENE